MATRKKSKAKPKPRPRAKGPSKKAAAKMAKLKAELKKLGLDRLIATVE